tara:strand:+ start:5455 stop:6036 length:582 start_codon:yes stop_codon:yes gene_type:complete
MASLLNTKPSETYKDLLTVASDTRNQGLESTVKQVFDGEGVGSPLYLSTSLVQVGTTNLHGGANVKVHGHVMAENISLINSVGGNTNVLSINSDGSVNFQAPIVTKSTVTFTAQGYDDLVMDATNSAMTRGDGTKGRVNMGDTSVTLAKGSNNLLTAQEDGTIRFQSISSGNEPSTPTAGDMIVIDGELNIGV